jgi:hypothetical protein
MHVCEYSFKIYGSLLVDVYTPYVYLSVRRLSNEYRDIFHRRKSGPTVKLTSHLHVLASLRMCGDKHPLPHTRSCRGDHLRTDILYFVSLFRC